MTTRRLIVPEVVQTSAMDCGPASLKAFLEGHGIPVSYGRLREACQTDIDGSSINTMEEVANLLGLEAEQIIVPVDHVLLSEARTLPAIAVVRHPNGATHFVVVWNRIGGAVQVMDPASGRRWKTTSQVIRDLYVHSATVPASAWREWAGSDDFTNVLRARLQKIGIPDAALLEHALHDSSWKSLATLDAACRCVTSLIDSRALRRGAAAKRVVSTLIDAEDANGGTIPSSFWSVTAAPADGKLVFRGAVLVRAKGRRQQTIDETREKAAKRSHDLSSAIEVAAHEPPISITHILRDDGYLNAGGLLAMWGATAVVLLLQALLYRGVIGIASRLVDRLQLFGGMLALVLLTGWLVVQRTTSAISVLRYGRLIENRLRIAFLEKVPRLGDRYFRSRLTGDMAERSHSVGTLRTLPVLASRIISSFCELTLTTLGIIWLDPSLWFLALLLGACAIGIPVLLQPALRERDLRVRAHVGALARFYLDAMIGLTAIRAHSADRTMQREQQHLLSEWIRASVSFLRTAVTADALQSISCTIITAWMLLHHLGGTGDHSASLILVFWALNLPTLGNVFATALRQYPANRNIYLRLLEPMGAPDDDAHVEQSTSPTAEVAMASGAAIAMRGVSVVAAGQTILRDLNLSLHPGEQVAIVGASGAGKSTLAGLLLGWHRPAAGELTVDGKALEGAALSALRRETAWVDPAIQIWNQTLLENLAFGNGDARLPAGTIIEQADLLSLLQASPDGLQRRLGEGGGLVSGGEGQRVRLGRAMARTNARLVILDEPFRGLDRTQRHALLERARNYWRHATLICITHDVSETATFDRALVIERGTIVEDCNPREALKKENSVYRAMFEREAEMQRSRWGSKIWRRLRVDEGALLERA